MFLHTATSPSPASRRPRAARQQSLSHETRHSECQLLAGELADYFCWSNLRAGIFSKSDRNGRTRSEDKAEAKNSPAKEPATGSVDSERAQNSITAGPSGWQRIATLSALFGILFRVYALFCMAVLIPFYGTRFVRGPGAVLHPSYRPAGIHRRLPLLHLDSCRLAPMASNHPN